MTFTKGGYGVSKREIDEFLDANPVVSGWLRKFRSSPEGGLSGSKLNKARILCRFFKWLRVVKNVDLSPSELLDRQLRLRQSASVQNRQWLLKLVLEHSRDNPEFEGFAGGRKYDIFSSIKNFCDYHEVSLTTAKGVFGRKRKRKNRRKQIRVEELKQLLGSMSQRDRTISIIQFQSGMEIGAVLYKFNYMWHSQIQPQLDAKRHRVKIEFDERKGNDTPYFTFISRDAVHELRKWLLERQKIVDKLLADRKQLPRETVEGEPIFITSRGTPLRESQYLRQFNKRMKGKVVTHMFRILFESEAKVPSRGIDKDYIKFWMGHITDLDDAGGTYDRNPEIREEVVEEEYAKLEPYINIYSGVQRRPLSEEDQVWMKFTDALRETLESDPDKMDALLKFVKDLPA